MGQTVGNLGNPNITGPAQQRAQWGDMDNSEKAARLISGTTQGLARGFQNYAQQSQGTKRGGGGMMPSGNFNAPQVDPSYFQPQRQGPNNLAFYGG